MEVWQAPKGPTSDTPDPLAILASKMLDPITEACTACNQTVSSQSGDAGIFKMLLEAHFKICPKMTPGQWVGTGQPAAKLVYELTLNKMEVKDKIHCMHPANWMRFESRWHLWRADQPLGSNLSVVLLDIFPNARNEIDSKLKTLFTEDDILKVAKEVLTQKTNNALASSIFHLIKQAYNKGVATKDQMTKDRCDKRLNDKRLTLQKTKCDKRPNECDKRPNHKRLTLQKT